VAPQLVAEQPDFFACPATAVEPDADGWLTLTLTFESLFAARERLLPFGAAVEVLSPLPLRLSLADFATQIVALYGTDAPHA
jgi:hypothetical protein